MEISQVPCPGNSGQDARDSRAILKQPRRNWERAPELFAKFGSCGHILLASYGSGEVGTRPGRRGTTDFKVHDHVIETFLD
jgi:hypothetical protein